MYIRSEKLSLQCVTKFAAYPRNSAYDCVFNPKYEIFYNNKPTTIKPLGLRIQLLLEDVNINIKTVQHFSFPSKGPWALNPYPLPLKIILDLDKKQIFKKYYLSVSKEIIFCWLLSHISIRGNELADLEAKSGYPY